jgi:hypothetical protein
MGAYRILVFQDFAGSGEYPAMHVELKHIRDDGEAFFHEAEAALLRFGFPAGTVYNVYAVN